MASKRIAPEEATDERDCQVPSKRPHTLSLASVGGNSTNGMALSLPELELLLGKLLEDKLPPMLASGIPPMLASMLPPMLASVLPPMLASVIPPMLASMLQRCPSPCRGLSLNQQQIGPSGARAFQLCFMNKLRSQIFTLTKIRAEDGSMLQIALCDVTVQPPRVMEDAPSMRVQICVLQGDFGSDGSEDWTAEDFNANILGPREAKPPLLRGDTVVTLEKGVADLNNLFITDSSCWTKCGKFRLGLKACQSGADIKEGRSEPTRVKDKRGERYEKRDRPSLDDEIWRLHKIGKNGKIRKQLSSIGIKTVRNLLQLNTTKEAALQQIIANIPGRAWDTIIEHAKACLRDYNERYIYQHVEAEKSVSLVFNCIYEVVEVSFDGQSFCSLKSLNSKEERNLVEVVKRQAYNNLNDLKPFEHTPHGPVRTSETINYGAPDQGLLQQCYFPIIDVLGPLVNNLSEQQQTWSNLCQPSTSTTSLVDEAAISEQVGSSQPPDQLAGWPPCLDDLHNAPFETCSTSPALWEQVEYFFNASRDCEAEPSKHVHTSSSSRAKKVWGKIRKWFAETAVRRKAKVYH